MKDNKPCILPWINFSTNPYGRPRVCGYSDHDTFKVNKSIRSETGIEEQWNNEYFKTIRKDFMNGTWPENCKRCQLVENLGGTSKRDDENKIYYEKYVDLISSHTSQDGTVDYIPPHVDVRTGATCNQKCIHCGTSVSSKWREDVSLFDKYPNTKQINVKHDNDRWIDKDSQFWDYLRENMGYISRYNFLGGESFANKMHNRFLKDLSESEYAKNVELQYVTNGILITPQRLEQLGKFKAVNLRLSVDAPHAAGEYFRFPMIWDEFMEKSRMIDDFVTDNNLQSVFDIAFQWTCSNISMFYLPELYPILNQKFRNIEFIFGNHVEFPIHMSVQNLPIELKDDINTRLDKIILSDIDKKKLTFYRNYMMENDVWKDQGSVLMNYLDDLDRARKCDWKMAFKEMELEAYDPR